MSKILDKISKIEKIIFEEKDLEKLGSKIVGLCVIEDDYEELVDENHLYGDFCELGASLEVEPRKDTYEELLEIFERLKIAYYKVGYLVNGSWFISETIASISLLDARDRIFRYKTQSSSLKCLSASSRTAYSV